MFRGKQASNSPMQNGPTMQNGPMPYNKTTGLKNGESEQLIFTYDAVKAAYKLTDDQMEEYLNDGNIDAI